MIDRNVKCPNCARPMGVEYVEVEQGRCQLWRWINECGAEHKVPPRTVSDCFGYTSRRIRELDAKLADQATTLAAAQRALRRHYAKSVNAFVADHGVAQTADMFPDDARIE